MGKKTRILVAIVMMLVMLLSQSLVLAEDAGVYVLNISGEAIKSELKLTIEDLKAMPEQAQIDEEYIYNSKKGQQSVELKGISLAYLFKDKAGLNVENAEVVLEASDGYPVPTQDLQEILNEDLKYILAYEINGEELEEVTVYRKLKEDGEFNTVFKSINKITVGQAITEVEENLEILLSEIDWAEYEMEENNYSTNNSLGFHKIVKVKGYDLLDTIGKDNLKEGKNYNVKFISSDGFEIEKTIEELTDLYFFSDFTEESKESIPPMIGKYTKILGDFPKDQLGTPLVWEDMDIGEEDLDKGFPKLVFGQTNIDDMNMSKWAKEVVKIVIEEIEEVKETQDIVFTDITEEYHFAEIAIKDLARRGIINGVGNDRYAPERELTRAQFCKIVVESLEYEKSEYTGEFSDVGSGNWAGEYIQTAIDKELFKGYTDGTFKPDEKINREQMATVVGRAAVIAEKPGSEKIEKFVMRKSAYLDKDDVSEWAENGVAWLEAEKVFVGIASENFYPRKLVNRAEAALIIYNTLFR